MEWFKHDSNANTDEKLQEVLLDYGLEGYGLYWYCLELIVNKIDQENFHFELKHDARIIARNTGSTVQRVQEMMRKFVDLGLFENDGNTITCLKLRARLNKSMTSNPYIRQIITNMKVDNSDYEGYLYFILAKNEEVKRIKIGRSKNPSARLNDLRKRSDCLGLNLEILHTIKSDDCVSLETEMHKKFKHLNLKDEWFEYSNDILEYIESLRDDVNMLRIDYALKEENRLEEIRKEKNRKDNIRGSRLAADWIAPIEFIEFCQTERPDLNPEYVANEFKDYWISIPGSKGCKTDWLATWRNWVRRQKTQPIQQSKFKNKSSIISDQQFSDWLEGKDG